MPKSSSPGGRSPEDIPKRLPPARTRPRRVQQLVVLAEGLIEERLRDGTASPTETTAIIRLGSEMERVNIERIQANTEYLKAQAAKALAETNQESMFKDAMEAMSRYAGDE